MILLKINDWARKWRNRDEMANIGENQSHIYQMPEPQRIQREEAGPAAGTQPPELPPAVVPLEMREVGVVDPVVQREDALAERRIRGNNLSWQRLVPGFDMGRVGPGLRNGCAPIVPGKRVYLASYEDKEIVIKYEDQMQTTANRLALSSRLLRNLGVSTPGVEVVRNEEQVAELQRATGDHGGGSVAVMTVVNGHDLDDVSKSEDPIERRALSKTSCFREMGRIMMLDHLLNAQPDRLRSGAFNVANFMVKPQRFIIGGFRVVAIDNSTDLLSRRNSTNELRVFINDPTLIGQIFDTFSEFELGMSGPVATEKAAFIQGTKMGVYEILDRLTSVEGEVRVPDPQKIHRFLVQSGCEEGRDLDTATANMVGRVRVFIDLGSREHLRMGTMEYQIARRLDGQHRIFS